MLTIERFASDIHPEDRVRPAGLLIKLGLSNDLGLIAQKQVLEHLICTLDIALGQTVDVNALGNALSDLQILVHWVDQVIHTLVVDLHTG